MRIHCRLGGSLSVALIQYCQNGSQGVIIVAWLLFPELFPEASRSEASGNNKGSPANCVPRG